MRERFWNDLGMVVDKVGNGYRLCMLGYLNEWIGERVRVGITGTFGIQEQMIMVEEEWWSSVPKGVKHSLTTKNVPKGPRRSEGKEHGKSGDEKDIYAAYVQDVRSLRGIGQGLSDHHVVLCKDMLVEAWMKKREIVDGAMRIRSEKLRENQSREGYARFLEGKRVEWDTENNVEHMWEQVKWARVESAK